jgi:hypothetical protein
MLAKKLSSSDSELPTRPVNPVPIARFAVAPSKAHLALVRALEPTARGLAWAQRGGARFDAAELEAILKFERLNWG